MGTCGKCRVKYLQDSPSTTPSERVHLGPDDVNKGIRLACMHAVDNDLALELFDLDMSTNAKEQLHAELDVALDPGVTKVFLKMEPASRHDQRPDTERVSSALGGRRLRWSKTVNPRRSGRARSGTPRSR